MFFVPKSKAKISQKNIHPGSELSSIIHDKVGSQVVKSSSRQVERKSGVEYNMPKASRSRPKHFRESIIRGPARPELDIEEQFKLLVQFADPNAQTVGKLNRLIRQTPKSDPDLAETIASYRDGLIELLTSRAELEKLVKLARDSTQAVFTRDLVSQMAYQLTGRRQDIMKQLRRARETQHELLNL